MEDDMQSTIPSTQNEYDLRRTGSSVSNLSTSDRSDIICILHPCTPVAFNLVNRTAAVSPQHVLQYGKAYDRQEQLEGVHDDAQQTFVLSKDESKPTLELALRFSSATVNPAMPFLFGRGENSCDFVIESSANPRVSNIHFRIFLNLHGVCMLQDLSTNGTAVDGVHLKSRKQNRLRTRMLGAGSVIEIVSPKAEEIIKFIVRFPSRSGHEDAYHARFQVFMQKIHDANETAIAKNNNLLHQAHLIATTAMGSGNKPVNPLALKNEWGMHWDGGFQYNVIGLLGKGAFAKVFRLATKADGIFFAAKELEKRRFVKNGILDRKLDNEMQIMKELVHPNIVQFIDYFDHTHHLYIIMEYVPFGTLQEHVADNGPLPENVAKSMAAQVFSALSYLHTKRITHRDIKPDNILLANNDLDDFAVKLTDFGLSKVVKDNTTFLKTFCGTLLYCAPEVFPQYESAAGPQTARKRTRSGGAQQKFHSYSQSVDIWSFGAVLWYSLCAATPFEGVMDAHGQGMFDRITQTPLSYEVLDSHGISRSAKHLLSTMLNTDPAARPDPQQCLRHPWFEDMIQITDDLPRHEIGLGAISEEDEGAHDGFEHDLSQLKIHEDGSHQHGRSNAFDSSEATEARESKRFRFRDISAGSSGSDMQETRSLRHGMSQGQPHKPMLFGEINQSALNQFGGRLRNSQDDISTDYDQQACAEFDLLPQTDHSGQARADSFTIGNGQQINTVSGAASLVRGLHMDSSSVRNPHSAESNLPLGDPQAAPTPTTPEAQAMASSGSREARQDTPTKDLETTPRPVPFSRRIGVPIPPQIFWDPVNPATHNLQYSSLAAGHDFEREPLMPAASFNALERPPVPPMTISQATANGYEPRTGKILTAVNTESNGSDDNDDLDVISPAENAIRPPPAEKSQDMGPPAPCVGRITTTYDSFTKLDIRLQSVTTSFGRTGTTNTCTHPDSRIARRAWVVMFDAPGLKDALQAKEDWTKLADISCFVFTEAKQGISVNGVKLMSYNHEGRRCYGKIAHGDVITLWEGRKGTNGDQGSGLSFIVDLQVGSGKEGRRSGEKFEVALEPRQARDRRRTGTETRGTHKRERKV